MVAEQLERLRMLLLAICLGLLRFGSFDLEYGLDELLEVLVPVRFDVGGDVCLEHLEAVMKGATRILISMPVYLPWKHGR